MNRPDFGRDGGLSSLGSSARDRIRASSEAQAAVISAWVQTWTCLGPGCRKPTPRHFYCSDVCRTASLAAERKKRGL